MCPSNHADVRRLPACLQTPAALSDLLSNFTSLAELNLAQCRTLRTGPLLALLSAAHGVTSLDLSGCVEIARLVVPPAEQDAPPLRWERVDVSGCKRLGAVEVERPAPRLASFLARACELLQEVYLPSGALTSVDVTNCTRLTRWTDSRPAAEADTGRGGASVSPLHAVSTPVSVASRGLQPRGDWGSPWGGWSPSPAPGSGPLFGNSPFGALSLAQRMTAFQLSGGRDRGRAREDGEEAEVCGGAGVIMGKKNVMCRGVPEAGQSAISAALRL